MQELSGLLVEWLKIHGFGIVLIVLIAWGIGWILQTAVTRFEKRYQQESIAPSEAEKRAKTLGAIIRTVITAVLYAVAVMIVGEFGVQIGPLLAGAGIAGLAIGFGAQTLVKDIINSSRVWPAEFCGSSGTSGRGKMGVHRSDIRRIESF